MVVICGKDGSSLSGPLTKHLTKSTTKKQNKKQTKWGGGGGGDLTRSICSPLAGFLQTFQSNSSPTFHTNFPEQTSKIANLI